MEDDVPPAYEVGDTHITTTTEILTLDLSNPSDEHVAPRYMEEELPGYAPPNVPIYEEPPRNPSLASFTIHQSSRKLRTIVPTSCSHGYPSYMITARSSPKVLSRKPDLTLTRLVDTSRNDQVTMSRNNSYSSSTSSSPSTTSISPPSTPTPTTTTIIAPNPPSKKAMAAEIAHLDITSHTSFPWMPRARITHLRNPLVTPRTYALAAPNFTDFHVRVGGRAYAWKLADWPSMSLVLVERGERLVGDRVVARFAYSSVGTDAVKGQVVGLLDVFEVPLDTPGGGGDEETDTHIADELEWVEVVIAGLDLVMQHWRGMGRHFRSTMRRGGCSAYGTEATGISDGRTRVAGF